MASIGSLTVSLSAEQAAFVAGMREAGKTVDNFSDQVKQSSKHIEGFNAHMLTSRSAIYAFAGIGGLAAAPLLHLVHAFEALPGPMGLALGGLLALREIYNSHGEAVKKSAEEQEKFHALISKSGTESGEAQKFADIITKAYEQMAIKIKETGTAFGTQINQLKAVAEAAAKSQANMDELNSITEQFSEQKLELGIRFDPKSSEYAKGIMDALIEKSSRLREKLNSMATGEVGFKEMTKSLNETRLEIAKMDREIAETARKKDERSREGTRRMEEEAAGVAKGLQGRFSTSSDKIREDIEKLGEAYGEGGIGEKGYLELKAKLNIELDDAKLKEALEKLNKEHSLMELKKKLSDLETPKTKTGEAFAGRVDTRFQSIESLTKGGAQKQDVRNVEEEKYLKAQIGILEKIALNTKSGAMIGVAG